MTNTSTASQITATPQALHIQGKNGETLATFNLRFSVGTATFTVVALDPKGEGFIGRTDDPEVVVEILKTATGVSVELKGRFAATDSILYFAGSRISSQYGRAFVPDADCRLFETSQKEDFHLTNSGMPLQDRVSKSDLWMIAPPPHILALGDNALGWCGLSIPEPMPVVSTHISCHENVFNLAFESYSPSHNSGRLPRVFLDAGLAGSKAIMDCHAAHARELGLLDTAKKCYAWWHNPVYCTWGDQCYIQKTAPRDMEDGVANPLDEALIMKWADGIRSIYPGEVNYILDAGWYDTLGDFEPRLSEFETLEAFKGVLDRLKVRGFRTILWYTPFWVQSKSKVGHEHPDYLVRRRDGSVYRDDVHRAFLDYSNPAVRAYTS